MKKPLSAALAAICIWLGLILTIYAQGVGGVEGVVIALDGKPVPGATVLAWSPDKPGPGILPEVRTDEGTFQLRSLPAGKYQLPAKKEEEGYPDARFTFYDSKYPLPTVLVRSKEITKGVKIRVGPKCARVLVRAVGAETGHRILRATIGFYEADSPQDYMGTGADRQGTFNILVPSTKPFRMRVSAAGYQTWYFGSDGTHEHASPMRLDSGVTREFVISLSPLKKEGHETTLAAG